MKRYKISIITLLTAVLMFLIAAAIMFAPSTAYAADRYVTVNGANVFYTSVRGAEVTYGLEEDGEGESHAYTMFRIGEDQKVTYRKNLAYFWKSASEEGETGAYQDRYFSMVIGFASTDFESYTIGFQSQQYVASEDKVSQNFLIFVPDGEKISVYVAQSDESDATRTLVGNYNLAENARFTIAFRSFSEGTYTVEVSSDGVSGNAEFVNVYKPYAKYVSSGDKAATPLTFSAKFADDAEDAVAEMKLYELNGQSFELYDQDGGDNYTQVIDNQPPVMCFTSTPAYVEYGTSYDFDFVLIDVLASSPRSTSYFYVLSGDQYKAENFEYAATNSAEDEEDEATLPKYTTVTSSSEIRVIRDDDTFVPSQYINDEDGNRVYGLVKIYYTISDVSGSSAQSANVFVDWYAGEEALVNIADIKGVESTGNENFLKLIDGKNGVTYADENVTTLEQYKQKITEIEEEYQAKIDEAIAKLEDGKLYAGSENYFYLPAFDYAVDEYLYPTDLTYSIYYKAKTSGSTTSLASNNLSIALTQPDVTYRFTIFVTDEFGSAMRYPDVDDEGNLVWKEIETGDIWDEEYSELLPFFEFDVSYKPATSEDAEDLALAYVGTSYSGVSFDINGVSNTYTTSYKLYTFDRDRIYAELGKTYTYDEFVACVRELISDATTRQYFTTIKPASELNENDSYYEEMSAYEWNATSVTFVPQSATSEYYVVELTITDNRTQVKTTSYASVVASVETTALKGEDTWVEDNLAAVILLSISGVCLIALVVLIVVRPKDKGDIDEVMAAEKSKKKAKKAGK